MRTRPKRRRHGPTSRSSPTRPRRTALDRRRDFQLSQAAAGHSRGRFFFPACRPRAVQLLCLSVCTWLQFPVSVRSRLGFSVDRGFGMKIVNLAVSKDLAAGVPLRLDLGCGPHPRPGHYGVDRVALPGVDVVADLNEPFADLPDDCAAEVYTRHTLEHVEKLLDLLAEIHRITRPGGRVEVIVPHFSNPYGYSDPTH